MGKHTDTPWRKHVEIHGKVSIFANKGDCLATMGGWSNDGANAAHIVRCVNALQGIDNPEDFIQRAIAAGVKP